MAEDIKSDDAYGNTYHRCPLQQPETLVDQKCHQDNVDNIDNRNIQKT